MSRYINERFGALKPYTPGEQPKEQGLIKLNTNENPFPPSPKVIEAVGSQEVLKLNLYPDPEAKELIKAASEYYGLPEEMIIFGNGSDELLAFAFMAFHNGKVYFPDISYGFYEVYAKLFGAVAVKVPLALDFTIDVSDYKTADDMVVIANPNAQTGTALTRAEIEMLLIANKDNLVLIDEAYVDFGGESSIELIEKYDNLLIVQTFSKSRSLAGGRVGLAFANEEIIKDLNKIRNSFNPYNLNRASIAAGAAALRDKEYFGKCIGEIKKTREKFVKELELLGFTVIPSMANFVMAGHKKMAGGDLYNALRERNIIVRHFGDKKIKDYVRITIGKREEMDIVVAAVKEILS